MAGKKKLPDKACKKPNDPSKDETVNVEFKVYMHCEACERSVVKNCLNSKVPLPIYILLLFVSLRLWFINMGTVLGMFAGVETFMTDMTKNRVVVKGKLKQEKLMKKTGKTIEIVVPKDDSKRKKNNSSSKKETETIVPFEDPFLTMLSDENPNACSVM
ncbi:hypothetical protein GIB67_007700 [Kingdonia uniflora]|uniref:HMA domain-containing protein n=1 Tax=Kingdonia uniflora TaxID=39325 RepID=A0A7J7N1I8_9MAGN|nr:hypothetical protein GIB67_007700 [Kingdonia uniflora]